MQRRDLFLWGGRLLAGWMLMGRSLRALAQSPRPRQTVNLQETLEYGLQARRPVEFAFIALVVKWVDEGRLPQSLVLSTFDWAREKRPYPFPYFVRALRLRAAKLGIRIPDPAGSTRGGTSDPVNAL